MLFIALFHDKPGHLQVRLDNRPAHLEWMAATGGAVKAAGPYLDDTGAEPRGSLLIVEAESLDAAKALLANDPYAKAGLFSGSEVHPWRWVVGAPAS
jgi:uncharacterized protein YciI